jgi:solute carrier family 25 (mitochondrial phosphate transporter), member 23/24/25/41
MPANHNGSGSALEAVLSFYSHVVTVNAEGDSLVSEETLEGLGTTGFLLQALFGSLLKLAKPDPNYVSRPSPNTPPLADSEIPQSLAPSDEEDKDKSTDMATKKASIRSAYGSASVAATTNTTNSSAGTPVSGQVFADTVQRPIPNFEGAEQNDFRDFSDLAKALHEAVKTRLTDLLPEPGYFLAGAVSGGVSRTATAPLDRLKVFLLVNTKPPANAALGAVKHGHPLVAIKTAGGPIAEAVVSLWKAGGLRTFFAGEIQFRKLRAGVANWLSGNGLNVVKIMPESAIRVNRLVRRSRGDAILRMLTLT